MNNPASAGRMAAITALAALVLLAGCDWVRPFEQVCEQRLGPTQVEVEAAPIQVSTNFTRSAAELTALGAAVAGRTVLGLTQTNIKWHVQLGGNGITRRFSGAHCLRPAVKVRLAMEPMTVSIAREYPQGSCIFDLTMAHEQKHVRTYENFLADVTTRVRERLRARFGDRVQYYPSLAEAEKQLEAMTRDTLGPLVGAAMQEVTPLQAAVDSPEEYFRLDRFQEACGPGR